MVYFVIGPSKQKGSARQTTSKVTEAIGNYGKASMMELDLGRFKMGNLDNMMQAYENIQKIEHKVEGVVKKIIKSYEDIEPKGSIKDLKVDSKFKGAVDIPKFLSDFKWDESKYPTTQSLNDLMKIIEMRINTVDMNLRKRIMKYNASKEKANTANRKDASSAITRDLNEIFSNAPKGSIKKSDFVSTKNFKTMVAVVPNDQEQKWLQGYEFINDYIVPKSAKIFETGADIGAYKLYRIVFFRRVSDDIVQAARKQFKVVLRDFEYDLEAISQRERDNKDVALQSTKDKGALLKTCKNSFKDIYSTFVHIKVLKVAVDSQMRYGSSDDYCVILINVNRGKERRIHTDLINNFAEQNKRDLYGTKEQIGDTEDFFPYAFSLINIP